MCINAFKNRTLDIVNNNVDWHICISVNVVTAYFTYVFSVDDAAAKKHALSFVQWIRTWSNRTFTTGLSSERNSEEKENILDEMFRRLVDQVAIAPADRGYNRVDHFVTVAKIGEV